MIGFVTWSPTRQAVRAGETTVLRMRFYGTPILRGPKTAKLVLRRRAAAAAERLQKLGITRAVFPVDFPHLELFEKRGVLPVETGPLYRALAAEWLRCALEEKGMAQAGAMAAVCGDRLSGELVRTVTELCLRYRYVLLDVPGGAEELARQLRREFGVSLLLNPGEERLAAADAALLFAPRAERKNPVVLPLYDGAVRLPVELTVPVLEDQLPAGCQKDQLLAALLGAGLLRPAQIILSESGTAP